MSRMYTAQELREMALVEESYGWDVVAKMLRQAADMMERADNVITANAKKLRYLHKDAEVVSATSAYILNGTCSVEEVPNV